MIKHSHSHDHGHTHDHGHLHPNDHGHLHPHDHGHAHPHGPGHNHDHAPPMHLHSHMEPEDEAAELQVLSAQFIDGFRTAADKAAYLRLAGVPLELEDPDGGPALKLVDLSLRTDWQVGTASPSFGSRELTYLPFPGPMIRERTNMAFVYVSLQRRVERDLRDFLKRRLAAG